MMRRITWITLVALAAPAAWALAKVAAPAKPLTIKGELVDTGCYLGHGARGEKHKGCATKCIAGGMPMGLLTSAGKLYLLTMDHDNPDPYAKAKEMAAEMVEVTGPVWQRNGMAAIEVHDVKAAPVAAK